MFQQVKNWGRWVPDDELGLGQPSLPAKHKQALSLARTEPTVSLVHNTR